ncbi:MAG: NFACT RNA binding domain-containing protein [Bacteroidota bacterium]
MHNNYYFLKRLTPVLSAKIRRAAISECFTQNKNELIIIFDNEFIIKAYLDPAFCCLSFPSTFHRARKNSVDLFTDIKSKAVQTITQFKNERCFSIEFDNGYRLLFKMHGNRSNLILFKKLKIIEVFRKSLKNDFDISLDTLDREIDQTFKGLEAARGAYAKLYPTFGPNLKQYLLHERYNEKTLEEQWKLLEKTVDLLKVSDFNISNSRDSISFSLLNIGTALETFTDPIAAITFFFNSKIQDEAFDKEKTKRLKLIDKALQRTKNYISSNTKKLESLKRGIDYSQIADIIMANLHLIPVGTKSIGLENFYDQNKKVSIRLNTTLSPQKNAENYYRKSKNQSVEISVLKQNIELKNIRKRELQLQLDLVDTASSLKELRQIIKNEPEITKKEASKPYSEINCMGYQILVGKNANANDTILRSFTQKNDLWLHAKDVSGSHVIIKEIPGRNFPKPVIEKAAELAAYHSKKRNETTCPVIYTPRKYVRKRKGDPPGMVIIDKEQVILVRPKA